MYYMDWESFECEGDQCEQAMVDEWASYYCVAGEDCYVADWDLDDWEYYFEDAYYDWDDWEELDWDEMYYVDWEAWEEYEEDEYMDEAMDQWADYYCDGARNCDQDDWGKTEWEYYFQGEYYSGWEEDDSGWVETPVRNPDGSFKEAESIGDFIALVFSIRSFDDLIGVFTANLDFLLGLIGLA